jgi:hypothetical protein
VMRTAARIIRAIACVESVAMPLTFPTSKPHNFSATRTYVGIGRQPEACGAAVSCSAAASGRRKELQQINQRS